MSTRAKIVKIKHSLKKFRSEALHEDQRSAIDEIFSHDITILKGAAGTGKTLVACLSALEAAFMDPDQYVDNIYITRPTVVADKTEELGFLPGGIDEKMEAWVSPIIGNLELLLGKEGLEELYRDSRLQLSPLAYLRGRTFLRSYTIVDEAQNVTHKQMEKILTRLGKNSKIILCGDTRQCDLPRRAVSGLPFLEWLGSKKIPEIQTIELTTNHRHPLVKKLLNYYETIAYEDLLIGT